MVSCIVRMESVITLRNLRRRRYPFEQRLVTLAKLIYFRLFILTLPSVVKRNFPTEKSFHGAAAIAESMAAKSATAYCI